jgi:hypothetical protein
MMETGEEKSIKAYDLAIEKASELLKKPER